MAAFYLVMKEEHERMRMMDGPRGRVAVIGAGVSGIAAAKCAMDEGLEPIVFEQSGEVGGVWRYDEALPDGGGPAYRGLHTNTSKQTTAFSDFPFPVGLPDYPPRVEMLRYLNDYADHFQVRERIRFRTEVVRVSPVGNGRWTVQSSSSTGHRSETFDAVFVGSGVFRDPVLPAVPGAETFTGTMVHSRAYTVPDRFAGQTVLVVGSGSSATDVALETSAIAHHVFMSVRGLAPHTTGQPTLAPVGQPSRWYNRFLPVQVRTRLLRHAVLRLSRYIQRLRPAGPDAPFVLGSSPWVPHEKLRAPLAAQMVTLKPALARLDGDSVVFTDGSRAQVDTIVFATGYALSFPFLDASIVHVSGDGLDLYRLVFPPEWPTLAFVGMFRVSGPAPPVAEMQARWAARIFRGAVSLPSAPVMRAAAAARMRLIARTGGNPFRLNAEAYEDLLAAEIGALPRLWCHPSLWRALLAGPPVAAQYRLDGPNRWSGAARTIRAAQKPSVPNNSAVGRRPEAVPRTEQA